MLTTLQVRELMGITEGPPPSRAAGKQRRRRARQREGKICLTIEVHEVPLVEALVDAGFLPKDVDHDRAAIAAAVERLLVAAVTGDYPQP